MNDTKRAHVLIMLVIFLLSLAGNCFLTGCTAPGSVGKETESTMQTDPPGGDEMLIQKDAPLPTADELIRQLAADSMVLLKNENNCLPLAQGTKLNLFGYNATINGFLLSGGGSGTGTLATESNKVPLADAFREAGVQINEDLLAAYTAWDTLDLDSMKDDAPQCVLTNPTADFYTEARLQQARAFSDTAVVVISRWGKENGVVVSDGKHHIEIPMVQVKSNLPTDTSRTYLQISTEEELMLEKVKANFSNVIVLLNLCNSMELGFLDDAGIDAAMFIGTTGQSGTRAIPQLLYGEITPSGKTTDVYPYHHKADPTWVNATPEYSDTNNRFVSYQEGIYYGYRWYETAFAEKLRMTANGYDLDFSSESGYRKIVQYPFGYGLSYTEFSWQIVEAPANGTALEENGEYSIAVQVTNIGGRPGKDVVQLYLTPPYTPGGIEKAAMNLVAFKKTDTLAPGESQTVTLHFTAYDLAAYDCYDANGNSHAGYELEKGAYALKLMRNVHDPAQMDGAIITLQAQQDICITADPDTGTAVVNRFTGADSYGSAADGGLTYMTRADFPGTFPTEKSCGTKTKTPENTYDEPQTIAYNKDQGLYLFTNADGSKPSLSALMDDGAKLVCNETLLRQLADYDNTEVWNTFLSQITRDETMALVKNGGYQTEAIASLGIPRAVEYDGPSGIYGSTLSNQIGWPSASLVGCCWNRELAYDLGRSVGQQAKQENVSGWYAPGVNLHRNPYTSRNYEYYSEDPILSGYLAAEVIRGAKNMGLSCYVKHFAVSEGGQNPAQVNTWLTEQAMREVYLKSFEIAIKEGGANAVMSAFNNIADVYCGHNQALLTDILRKEWGFRGSVVTDWWGEYMRIDKCVLAGNDKMLLMNDTEQYMPLGGSTTIGDNAARDAVKHIIYSKVDSYVTALDYAKQNG